MSGILSTGVDIYYWCHDAKIEGPYECTVGAGNCEGCESRGLEPVRSNAVCYELASVARTPADMGIIFAQPNQGGALQQADHPMGCSVYWSRANGGSGGGLGTLTTGIANQVDDYEDSYVLVSTNAFGGFPYDIRHWCVTPWEATAPITTPKIVPTEGANCAEFGLWDINDPDVCMAQLSNIPIAGTVTGSMAGIEINDVSKPAGCYYEYQTTGIWFAVLNYHHVVKGQPADFSDLVAASSVNTRWGVFCAGEPPSPPPSSPPARHWTWSTPA